MPRLFAKSQDFPVMIDGELKNTIAATDRGFQYGDGVFETMRLQNGVLPLLPAHLQRLRSSCDRLLLSLPEKALLEYLDKFLAYLGKRKIESGVVKLVITRGDRGIAYQPAETSEPCVVLYYKALRRKEEERTHPSIWFQPARSLYLSEYALPTHPNLAGMKTLNSLPYVMAVNHTIAAFIEQGAVPDVNQILLCDADDNIVECALHNIFIRKQTRIMTPDLKKCGVAGVMRHLVIEILKQSHATSGFETYTKPCTLDEVFDADEVFITNAVEGVVPIAELHLRKGSQLQASANYTNHEAWSSYSTAEWLAGELSKRVESGDLNWQYNV